MLGVVTVQHPSQWKEATSCAITVATCVMATAIVLGRTASDFPDSPSASVQLKMDSARIVFATCVVCTKVNARRPLTLLM